MIVKAAIIEQEDGPFVFRDVEVDEIRANEILVRIVATGICHTDAHVRAQGYETPLPIVLGHEGAGSSSAWAPTSAASRRATTS